MTPVTFRKPTLLNIPMEMLNHIARDFDIETVLNFRKTCRLFRLYVHNGLPNFNPKLEKLVITQQKFYKDTVKVELRCTDGIEFNIIYRKNGFGCIVEYSNPERGIYRKKSVDIADYAEMAGTDVGTILNNQRGVMKKLIVLNPEDAKPIRESAEQRLWKNLGAHLETRNSLLQVQKFKPRITIRTNREQRLLTTLRYLDPQCLKYIHLFRFNIGTRNKMNLNAIIQTDQWKMASRIRMWQVWTNAPLQHFLHFKRADILVDELSVDELAMLREIRLQNPALETFKIWFNRLTQENSLNARLGPAARFFEHIGDIRVWPIPNDEKKVVFGRRFGWNKSFLVQNTSDNIDEWAREYL